MEPTHGHKSITGYYYFRFYKKNDNRVHRWSISYNLASSAKKAQDKFIEQFGYDTDIVKFYLKTVRVEHSYFVGKYSD